ncbi:MAG: amidohydrolase [Caldilineaceae bacterium]|nr:amidohydrolase [Caldilineaceae bacterium]
MPVDLLHLDDHPTLILHNARIYTQEPARPWAEATAIRGPIVTAIGSNQAVRALAANHTRQIDMGGRLILPGLCDAHIHLHEWAINLTRPHLASARSRAEMMAQLAEYAAPRPTTSWIVCQGWNESWWGEQDFPTASDLDAVTQPDQPAIAYRSDMHIAVANHAALARAGITSATPNPPGGLIDRDALGQPTGVLRELAINLVTAQIAPLTREELLTALRAALPELHRLGITAVHDQRIKDADEGPAMLAAYTRLQQAHGLRLRVNCNIAAHQLPDLAVLGLRSGFGNDYLRLGHVKVFADGSLGSRTAWMLEPFEPQSPTGATAEAPNYGVNVTPPEQMAAEFYQAQQLGFPISVHAIGDRANRVVLDLFEELAPQLPPLPIPHRIEHVQTIAPADIPRLAQLNITASVQPLHLTDDRDLVDRYWGKRARNTYAFRSLFDAGTRLAFGSDAPVADANPFLGIHAALVRHRPLDMQPSWQPQEILTLDEIIHAYTLGAAQAAGWDATIGSLSPGKRADLVVLDRDIFALAQSPSTIDEIAATQIMSTCFDGEFVYLHPSFAIQASEAH